MSRSRHLWWILPGVGVLVASGLVVARLVANGPGATGPTTDGAQAEAVLESARVYSRDQQFDRAEAVLRAGVVEYPGDHDLREALGGVLLAQGKHEEALAQYERIIADGSPSATVAFTAGSIAAVLGRAEQAAGFHERAQAIDPGNPDYPIHLARAQIELGRLDDAKVNLTRSAVLDEGRGLVWGMLAELALRENRLEVAGSHIARARSLEPDVAAWLVVESRILKRRGEPERALLLLERIGESERWTEPVLQTMAECLGMLGRPADALALYEVAVETRPGEPAFRLEAALWAERLGRRERALELARQAVMMGETRASAVVTRLEE